jgi:adenosylcobinamide kinase / adenosylcobinamide-phosphate guanylyltransferase
MVAADLLAMPLPPVGITLITGGSRSGKSRWAEALAQAHGHTVVYLATAADRPGDALWQRRVALHQQRRPPEWICVETGPDLVAALSTQTTRLSADPQALVLVDSLGTWLAQHLDDSEAQWQERQSALLLALTALPGPVLVVSEEVGLGVVPPTAIGNRFRDRMGTCQQALMQKATASWLVVAGRAIHLHAAGLPVPGC